MGSLLAQARGEDELGRRCRGVTHWSQSGALA